uniref:Uncharacterized protein n=1 Tax=Caenorhabditis japonica TaxID=281687 RepID=A0A8R1HZD5_CAEJA
MSGENVYGFVRGHRNDGAESQMIVVQLGTSDSALRMIAKILAFVDYAKEQVYWARDFAIVFVDGGAQESVDKAAFAIDAFLLKYQKVESISSEKSAKRSVEADEVKAQTGAVIAGVVYDLSGMVVKGTHILNLETNGLNGQQVNLDVFNGIVKIADSKYGARVAIFGTIHRHSSPWMDISPFAVPLKAIYTQAFTSIEGIHSVMGKYVLSDDMHFASVAFYMPAIGILLTPLLISAYYEWTKLDAFQMSFNYLLLHCIGFAIYVSTTWIFGNIGPNFVIQWIKFPFYGIDGCDGQLTPSIPLITTCIIVLSAPIGLLIFWKWPVQSVGSVRMLCLLETSLILGCLSLINFGLAILSAAVIVPIVFLMTFESRQRTRSFLRTAVLSILSPIGVTTYLASHASDLFGVATPHPNFTDLRLAAQIVHKLIEQHVLFGSHQFFLMCCAVYPVWNMLFACSSYLDPEEEEVEEKQAKKEN